MNSQPLLRRGLSWHPFRCYQTQPLAPTARRGGWIGCNILLDKIPIHARISVVSEGTPLTPREVRSSYNRLRPTGETTGRKTRLDPRRAPSGPIVRQTRITLADVYAHAGALAKLHPKNAHVRDKIRQQLQVLRDLGLLEFLGRGEYRLS